MSFFRISSSLLSFLLTEIIFIARVSSWCFPSTWNHNIRIYLNLVTVHWRLVNVVDFQYSDSLHQSKCSFTRQSIFPEYQSYHVHLISLKLATVLFLHWIVLSKINWRVSDLPWLLSRMFQFVTVLPQLRVYFSGFVGNLASSGHIINFYGLEWKSIAH